MGRIVTHTFLVNVKGGPGSGHRGHAGRPGQRGGGRASGSSFRSFGSDLSAAQSFLESKGLNPELSDTFHEALIDYKDLAFQDVNDGLRSGKRLWEVDHGPKIDLAIHKTSLPEGVATYRGVGKGVFDSSDQVGKVFNDKAFVSTTLNKEFAKDHAAGALLEIRLPKGHNALNMEAYNMSMFGGGGGDNEFELLLQQGSSFRIIGDSQVGSFREIIMEPVT